MKPSAVFNADTSRVLAMLRWPLAMCIVAVHWFQLNGVTGALGIAESELDMPVTEALMRFVSVFLTDNGVASFFFISGYLFFAGGEMTAQRYKCKLRKRVDTLLIPYILWNVLFVLFLAAHYLPGVRDLFPRMTASGWGMSWTDFFSGMLFTTTPHNQNLWFIRELMTCVLLAPLLASVIKRFPWMVYAVLVAGYFVALHYGNWYFVQLFSSLVFFGLGSQLGSANCNLMALSRGKGFVAASAFALCGIIYWFTIVSSPEIGHIVKFVSLPCVIVLALAIAGWFVRRGKEANAMVTAATFFVFASHPFAIAPLQRVLYKVMDPHHDLMVAAMYIVGYVLLLAILVGVYRLLALVAPRLLGVLTGRRSGRVRQKGDATA